MSFESEFPALYAVSKMYPTVLQMIGDNIESYSVDVRIDYERWVQFEKEYGEWSRTTKFDTHRISGKVKQTDAT